MHYSFSIPGMGPKVVRKLGHSAAVDANAPNNRARENLEEGALILQQTHNAD